VNLGRQRPSPNPQRIHDHYHGRRNLRPLSGQGCLYENMEASKYSIGTFLDAGHVVPLLCFVRQNLNSRYFFFSLTRVRI
jgi:hypothetical protein